MVRTPTVARPPYRVRRLSVWSWLPGFVLGFLVVSSSCSPTPSDVESTVADEVVPEEETASEPAAPAVEWAIAIHGGAGVIDRDKTDPAPYYASLQAALTLGRDLLDDGTAAIEVVEQVVRSLEDDPKFNAGRGAVFTSRGTHELDAAIMDGRTLSCGSVASLKNVRNPITLARRVMEQSPHVFLTGQGAEDFSKETGVRRVQQSYFYTQERYDAWRQVVREEREARRSSSQGGAQGLGTVGAVVLDRYGNLAAGTSTGGLTNKRYGRVGDVPIIGAGTYANNETAAISATGKGEQFIRHTVAHDISALIEYQNRDVQSAARTVIEEKLDPGDGGVIVVGRDGSIAMVFSTPGMFRGAADATGRFEIGIWQELRTVTPDSTPATGGS